MLLHLAPSLVTVVRQAGIQEDRLADENLSFSDFFNTKSDCL